MIRQGGPPTGQEVAPAAPEAPVRLDRVTQKTSQALENLPFYVEGREADGHLVVRDTKDAPVALIPEWMGRREQEAVAGIMAASPELLLAIRVVVMAYQTGDLMAWGSKEWESWMRRVAPGLAKAMGLI